MPIRSGVVEPGDRIFPIQHYSPVVEIVNLFPAFSRDGLSTAFPGRYFLRVLVMVAFLAG